MFNSLTQKKEKEGGKGGGELKLYSEEYVPAEKPKDNCEEEEKEKGLREWLLEGKLNNLIRCGLGLDLGFNKKVGWEA